MVLSFKPQFVEPILNGTKVHTIREDSFNRWKNGMKIHFATGVRTKEYKQFKSGFCMGIQSIEIDFPRVRVDGMDLIFSKRLSLAKDDGFNGLQDFFEWFNKPFKGKIIHWTNLWIETHWLGE